MTGRLDIVRSPLVQAAAVALRLTPWWAAYLVAFGIVVVAALLVTPVVLGFPDSGFVFASTLAVVGLHAIIALLLWAWLHWYERRPWRTLGYPRRATGRGEVTRGFAIGVGLSGLASLVLLVLGALHLTPTESGTVRWSALLPAAVSVVVWLFVAWVQEALTRGFLLQATGLQIAGWLAVAGQAVLWAVVRVAGVGATDAMALLNLVLIGMALALVALSRGTLWLAMGLQAGWSWFEAGVLGMNATGGPQPPSVVSLVPTSASWLSGGEAGVVASPVVTVIVVLAGAWVYRRSLAPQSTPARID